MGYPAPGAVLIRGITILKIGRNDLLAGSLDSCAWRCRAQRAPDWNLSPPSVGGSVRRPHAPPRWGRFFDSAPSSGHLNSRPIDGILGGPTDTIGMNKFGAVTLGCGSTAPLEAFSRPARTDCRWHASRYRQASVSRK